MSKSGATHASYVAFPCRECIDQSFNHLAAKDRFPAHFSAGFHAAVCDFAP